MHLVHLQSDTSCLKLFEYNIECHFGCNSLHVPKLLLMWRDAVLTSWKVRLALITSQRISVTFSWHSFEASYLFWFNMDRCLQCSADCSRANQSMKKRFFLMLNLHLAQHLSQKHHFFPNRLSALINSKSLSARNISTHRISTHSGVSWLFHTDCLSNRKCQTLKFSRSSTR